MTGLRHPVFRLVLLVAVCVSATAPNRGGAVLAEREAREWKVDEWLNGDPGQLGGHKGRVVLLHFFQLWCPGSNHFSIPVMNYWEEKLGSRDDFMIVGIHSVFEGHDFQGPDFLKRFVKERSIQYPVGIDAYGKDDPVVPVTMKRYDTGGTPAIAIVDKAGNMVFTHFGEFDVAAVEFYIERLLKEESRFDPPPKPQRADPNLSGVYALTFQQTSKTCGPLRPTRQVGMRLDVHKDRLEASFDNRFMGLQEFELDYDPRTLEFQGRLHHRVSAGANPVEVEAEIRGRFVRGSRPARLEYSVAFTKQASTPQRSCEIDAEGFAELRR